MIYAKWLSTMTWLETDEMNKEIMRYLSDKDEIGKDIAKYLPYIGGDKGPYLVVFSEGNMMRDSFQSVELKSSLPLEMADLDGSKEAFSNWVEKYDLPSFPGHRKTVKMSDGRIVYDFLSLTDLRTVLASVKAATMLWQYIAEDDIPALRQHIEYNKGEIAIKLAVTHDNFRVWRFPANENLFEKEPKYLLSRAALVLKDFVDHGLLIFPPGNSIEVAFDPTSDDKYEFDFKAVSKPITPMSFIWTTIRDELCQKGGVKWHFRRCADCHKWEDIAPPRRRSSWTRCDDCVAKIRKAGNLQRAKKSQNDKRRRSENK